MHPIPTNTDLTKKDVNTTTSETLASLSQQSRWCRFNGHFVDVEALVTHRYLRGGCSGMALASDHIEKERRCPVQGERTFEI